jgi:hypothetical protein
MSDEIRTKLMVLVERVVRPVRANVSRKRQMREELLAHVTAIFAEEVEKSGDPAHAFEQTQQRFGNPGEISSELQRTVSLWNRIEGYGQSARQRPGESLAHYALRTTVVFLVVYLGLTGFMVFPVAVTAETQEWVPSMPGSPVCAACPVFAAFLAVLIAPVIARALFGTPSERNLPLAIVCLTASFAFLPATAHLAYSVLIHIGTDRDLKEFAEVRWFSFVVAPMFPLCLIAGGRIFMDDYRDAQKWRSLEI